MVVLRLVINGACVLGLSEGRANRVSGAQSRICFVPAYVHVGYTDQFPNVFNSSKRRYMQASRMSLLFAD